MKILIKNINDYSKEFYQDSFKKMNLYQKRKINKIKNPEEKYLSILGLMLVADNLSVDVSKITYSKGVPYVKGKDYFSIAHKDPYVGIVINDKPVGIDLEVIRDIDGATLNFLGVSNSKEALISWTRKESTFKCGYSLSNVLKTMIVNKKIIMTICTSNEIKVKKKSKLFR